MTFFHLHNQELIKSDLCDNLNVLPPINYGLKWSKKCVRSMGTNKKKVVKGRPTATY